MPTYEFGLGGAHGSSDPQQQAHRSFADLDLVVLVGGQVEQRVERLEEDPGRYAVHLQQRHQPADAAVFACVDRDNFER